MKCRWNRNLLHFTLFTLVVGACSPVSAKDKDKEKKKGKDKAMEVAKEDIEIAEDAVSTALPPELTEMFPIGREFKGVSIPNYNKNVLSTVMTSDSITRIDEQYLDLKNLVISIYNSEGKPDTTISMARASYDLVIGELVSKTPSKIEQPKFTMTGNKMTFKTESQISLLEGDVKLVVPDVSGFTPDFGFSGSN